MREHLIPFWLVDEKTNLRGGTMEKDLLYEDSDFEVYMRGYRNGCKETAKRLGLEEDRMIGFVDGTVEVEKLKTDSDDYYEAYCAGARAVYSVITETQSSIKDGWNVYSRPMTLDELKKQEDLWESIGEPMTQEELDELHHVEEDFDEIDEIYDCGFKSGRNVGFNEGYGCGYNEAKEYNVILDGEILDEIADFKKKILSYRKQPWEENAEHNHMVFEIHKGLVELTETWVMNQVWDYWHRREEEIENG